MFNFLTKLLNALPTGPDTSDPRKTGGHLCGNGKCPRCAPIIKKLEKQNHKDRIDLFRGKDNGKWNDGGI